MTRVKYVALAAASVAILAAVAYFWSDRRQIRRQLDGLAETASVSGTESDIDRLARGARLSGYFPEGGMIRPSPVNSSFVGGRRAVAGMAMQAAIDHHTMKVSFENLRIDLTDSSTASATMTVVVATRNPESEAIDLRDATVTLRKISGTWLISQALVLPARVEGQ